jgi:pimeloyl-ACP methyl ester carboxylesterase
VDNEGVLIETPRGTFDALAAGPEGGRPVLLLHGFPESAAQWEHQLPALADAGYRAVAIDQRGYSPGVRPAAVEAYGPDELIADVVAVANALGWPRFDLVGHDWGSAVAWMTAGAHRRLRGALLRAGRTDRRAQLVPRDAPASAARAPRGVVSARRPLKKSAAPEDDVNSSPDRHPKPWKYVGIPCGFVRRLARFTPPSVGPSCFSGIS